MRPMVVLLYIDFHLNSIVLGTFYQTIPIIGIRLNLSTTTNHFFIACRHLSYYPVGLAINFKSQRCDVNGHCDIGVVGIDMRQLVRLAELLGYLGAAGCQYHGYCGE